MHINLHYDLTEREASLGAALHTILRKHTDSKWSCVIWNLVHIAPDWMWEGFLRYACNYLDEHGNSNESIRNIFHQFDSFWFMDNLPVECDHFIDLANAQRINKDHNIESAFICAVNMVPELDATIIANALEEYTTF